ncbi:MAG TPA: hypothetical protein VNC17_11095 [Thermoleophilaceae bacterium]|nr:hypothetical protein [Thermoleophilaceae bacterium]
MQHCQVCGRSFDPLGFQVVVPELGRGFDRIECAQSARTLAGPGSRLASTPLVAIVKPVPAALMPAAVGSARALRPLITPASTLGLLAAGTAAAVALWLNALGADPSSFTLGRLSAPPAFGHQTVQAHVQPAPPRTGPAERKAPDRAAPVAEAPDRAAPVSVVRVVTAPSPTGFAPAPATDGAGSAGEPQPQPSFPPKLVRPATLPPRGAGPGKATGKGHAKHGKGHAKHGETDGAHSPGHGQGKGNKP